MRNIAVYLHRHFLLSLNDLLAVVREFLCPEVSRSGLDRCLRRHGLGNLRDRLPKEAKAPRKAFKAYEPGFLHMGSTCRGWRTRRRYLFVAIDRATRWVFLEVREVREDKTARSARAFLKTSPGPARFASRRS